MTTIDLRSTPSPFDAIRQVNPDGSEFWSARALQPLLGYERWERFEDALDRARAACSNSGMPAHDHFRGAAKYIQTGLKGTRGISDTHMTRYGAYLVAMNGDPRKPAIAAAQTYFAMRTREAEMRAQGPSVSNLEPPKESISERELRVLVAQVELRNQLDALAAAKAEIEDTVATAKRDLAVIDAMGNNVNTAFKEALVRQVWATYSSTVGPDRQLSRPFVPSPRQDPDPVRQWLNEVCEPEPYGLGTQAAVLHASFVAWCRTQGVPEAARPTMTKVGRRLSALGFRPRRGDAGRNYRPLRLRDSDVEHLPRFPR